MTFAETLTSLLKNRKITQKSVSAHLNISQRIISNWITGKTVPKFEKVVELTTLLNDVSLMQFNIDKDYPLEDRLPSIPIECSKLRYVELCEYLNNVFERFIRIQSDPERLRLHPTSLPAERCLKITRLRIEHGLTLREVGDMLKISRERVRQIETRTLRILRNAAYVRLDLNT
jgi:transcriptional regulator with XRE-family HTH domain